LVCFTGEINLIIGYNSCVLATLKKSKLRQKALLFNRGGHVKDYVVSNYLICQPLAGNFYIIFTMLAIYHEAS
jgi:hypothetical protein